MRASEGDELREEDKEHYRALLIRARDKLYVTLDRIRGNKHHVRELAGMFQMIIT